MAVKSANPQVDWDTLMRIYKEFFFDAAHFLPHAPEGHPNRRLHGHSFRVVIWLEGTPDPVTGQIRPLDLLSGLLADTRARLDHQHLNEIDGLDVPTLENIARWLWQALSPELPELNRIEIHRPSCQEGCLYDGPSTEKTG